MTFEDTVPHTVTARRRRTRATSVGAETSHRRRGESVVPDDIAEGGGERGRGRVRPARARRVRLPRANRGRVQRRSFGGGVERGRRRRGGRGSLGGGERVGGGGGGCERVGGGGGGCERVGGGGGGCERVGGALGEGLAGDPFGDSVGAFAGILRRVLLDPTLQGGASEAVPAGELDVVSGLRSRRWAPTRGESGKEFRASLFGVAFDLANHAGLFLGGESVIEVAGGFRGGGPRGTLHRGFLGVAGVVVVARFRVHLRVDEFLEGKILVVLDLGGASERVSSRAIRPVAEGKSRPPARRKAQRSRGDEENMSRSTSTRASAQVAARSAARSVANATKADVRVAVMGFGVQFWGDREMNQQPLRDRAASMTIAGCCGTSC